MTYKEVLHHRAKEFDRVRKVENPMMPDEMTLEETALAVARDVMRYKLKGKLSAFEEEMGELIADQTKALKEANDRVEELEAAIAKTLDENGHLADGDICTLIDLKQALQGKE